MLYIICCIPSVGSALVAAVSPEDPLLTAFNDEAERGPLGHRALGGLLFQVGVGGGGGRGGMGEMGG